jgi:kinesin family protein 18/19
LRPESAREKGLDGRRGAIVRVIDKNMLVFDPSDNIEITSPHKRRALGVRRGKDLRFAFDRVFDENSTQMEVYHDTARNLLEGVMDGYNATVFAYGATGAGKTYTMMGNDSSGPGVLVLTMIDLFNMIEANKAEKQYKVAVSFLEVYNETLRDLLANPSEKPQPLELREDKIKGVSVAGLSQHFPENADEVLELVKRGTANRTQFGTAANVASSRSHAVFQIIVEQTDRTANIQTDVKVGKLSLIDLAGSERASVTKNRGARLVEGANINKSLLALANCINALGKNKGKGYVPYRNSKLTRLLKDSLGGNCRTVMIANISPNSCCYEDTYNTLKYANRAKNIKTSVVKNVHNVNFHITKYTKIIDELRSEVSELKRKLAIKTAEAEQQSASHLAEFEKERASVYNIRETMTKVYQEQLKDRRTLMEIEENDRQNALKVMSIRNEISRWKREHPEVPFEEMPLRIHTLHKDADSLLHCTKQYIRQKEKIRANLQSNIANTKSLQEKALLAVKNEDLRQIIDLQARIHDIEVMNLDLERMAQHHRAREQHLKLIVEDTQYSTNKIQETLHLLFDHLRNVNGVTPELEMQYNISLMHCAFLSENMNGSISECEHQSSPSSPISRLNSSVVHEALKTPTNINVPGARKRKLRFGESPHSQKHSVFQLSVPNSPMRTSPSPTQKQKKLRIHSANSPGNASPRGTARPIPEIPILSLEQLARDLPDKNSINYPMDISDDGCAEFDEAAISSNQNSPRDFSPRGSPRSGFSSADSNSSILNRSVTVASDPLKEKFQQFEDFVHMNNSARNHKNKLKTKQAATFKRIIPTDAWGEKHMPVQLQRKLEEPKKANANTGSKRVKFVLPLEGLQASSVHHHISQSPNDNSSANARLLANNLPSYMQSTASAQNRVSHTLRPRSVTQLNHSFDSAMLPLNIKNKENANSQAQGFSLNIPAKNVQNHPINKMKKSSKNGLKQTPVSART